MKTTRFFLILVFILSGFSGAFAQKLREISIDFGAEGKEMTHYWKSTGFTPAKNLLRPDMQLTAGFMGAVNHNGITYVRPHFLLNLVEVENPGTSKQRYNWKQFDRAMDEIVNNNMKLIFEIMGYSSGYHFDFTDSTELYAFRDLVSALAKHLIDRYGEQEVLSWYFETSNEPDIKYFWNQTYNDYLAFLNYYDACSEGLKAVNPDLRFGGPGTARGLSPVFKLLMAHCDVGRNYFTGEKGVRLDFVSVHRKFLPNEMVEREKEIVEYLRKHHPRFAKLPFLNDEADPLAGWSKRYWWRTGAWYAAFVAQSVDVHNRRLIDSLGVNYVIQSNDNAFMGTWGQRTHLARFIENDSSRFFLIKKPVLTVMSLMSRLGNRRFQVKGITSGSQNSGVIATQLPNRDVALLFYNKPVLDIDYNWKDKMQIPLKQLAQLKAQDEVFKVKLTNIQFSTGKKIVFRLDNEHGNPYGVFQKIGEPEKPTTKEVLRMQDHEEPVVSENSDFQTKNEEFHFKLAVPPASVCLVVLSEKKRHIPPQVAALKAKKYTGLNGEEMVFLNWDGQKNPHLQTYEVFFAPEKTEKFRKINTTNLIDAAFLHIKHKAGSGRYKVRAVDFWGRNGEFSQILDL